MPFLGAHPALLHALIERGITEPTPVQRAILEVGDPAVDLMVSAQTGSGKTVGFGLAIAPTVLGDAERFEPPARPAPGAPLPGPRVLVVTPTRELAVQVAGELTWLYARTGARIATCVGGMDVNRERHALARAPQFVIGTPGRLCDHLDRKNLALDRLQVVVLDEADEMLDMGFRDELEKLLDAAPAPPGRPRRGATSADIGTEAPAAPSQGRRTLLFSATIPPGIAALAKRYTRDAVRLAAGGGDAVPHADIEHRAIPIRPADRVAAIVNLLRYHEARSALVFCATRDGVQDLATELAGRGFAVVALSGELSQRERTSALAQLREGRARVLVATDVAARGLDLPDLELVVHADLPQNRDNLIHRSGRTGRAGKKGTSVMLVPAQRRGFVERVLVGRVLPLVWAPAPTAAEIEVRDLARLDDDLARDLAGLTARERELGRALAARVAAEDLAALVIRGKLAAAPAPAPVAAVGHDHPRRDDRPPRDPRPRDAGPRAGAPRAGRDNGAPVGGPAEPAGPGFVMFRVNIGHRGNADPRWLIPILCRRGEIDRHAIGKIRILGSETHVEIARDKATAFAAAVARPDARDRKVRITLLE